jgi:hypothetical protein
MVMHWPGVVLLTTHSLLVDCISFYFAISVPKMTAFSTENNFLMFSAHLFRPYRNFGSCYDI